MDVIRCLDEEAIQHLLDGELLTHARLSAESHLGECGACLAAKREAECEAALLSSFFAPQPFVGVPTAKLWGGIHHALFGSAHVERHNG